MKHPKRPVERVRSHASLPDLVEVLADRMSGSDLTTLLLEVMRHRASAIRPADVLHRYATDRFVAPADLDLMSLRAAEDLLLSSLPPEFERLQLAPVVPTGTHSVLAGVDQNNVVSTIRGSDVAADATNGLALEATLRRRELLAADPKSPALVRLSTVQRVLRAQRFDGPHSFAHFGLFGAVTAGRDTGDRRFERTAVAEHVSFMARALVAAGATAVRVETTDHTGGSLASVADAAVSATAVLPQVEVASTPTDAPGGAYYAGFRFQLYVRRGDDLLHLGDGGLVDWSQRVLSNDKERLVISGIGVDRFALLQGDARA